jgi:hypothetical protein
MEHAARFLVGRRRVGVLDEVRRVRRMPRVELATLVVDPSALTRRIAGRLAATVSVVPSAITRVTRPL